VPKSLDLRRSVWYNPDMSSIYFNMKGNGLEELYKEFAILVAFGIVFLAIATLKFKKKID
jgi:ABC-2 type transport system permease protein